MNSCIFLPKGKTKRPTTVDVVIPGFNDEESLTLFFALYAQLAKSHPQYAFNIIVIDNGSSDATLQIAKEFISSTKDRICLESSKNFGKEALN